MTEYSLTEDPIDAVILDVQITIFRKKKCTSSELEDSDISWV